MGNDVTRFNAVQIKTSFRSCFSNAKDTNQLERQAIGILLLPSAKIREKILLNTFQWVYFILEHST